MPKKFIIMPSKLVIVLMILSVILIYGALAPVIFHLETKFPPAILLFLLATGLCLVLLLRFTVRNFSGKAA